MGTSPEHRRSCTPGKGRFAQQDQTKCVASDSRQKGRPRHRPLKEHLGDICKLVVEEKADFGIVVDPDVDRLAFISNDKNGIVISQFLKLL